MRTKRAGASEVTGKKPGASEAAGKKPGASEATGKRPGAKELSKKKASTAEATRKGRTPARGSTERRRKPSTGRDAARRRPPEQPQRRSGPRGTQPGQERDQRALKSGPNTTPVRRPVPPKNAKQAKARAKARKAKAPKVIRPPLRDRVIARLVTIDLRPRTLAAKVPFVVLVIGALGVGLGATLWLSTYSAERSYELGHARETNRLLSQQKESLERDVLEAQAAPALAEAARNLGMIPSRDTAHLVQDPAGNWVVVGDPKPAEGTPPPPLNVQLPSEDAAPTVAAAAPNTAAPAPNSVEVPVRVPSPTAIPPAMPLAAAPPALPELHAPNGAPAPGPVPEAAPAPAPEVVPAPAPEAVAAPVPVAPPPAEPVPAPPAPEAAPAVLAPVTP